MISHFPSAGQAAENISQKVAALKQKLAESIEYAEEKNMAKAQAEFGEFEAGYEEIEKAAGAKDREGHEEIEKMIVDVKKLLAAKEINTGEIEENIEGIEHELNEIFGESVSGGWAGLFDAVTILLREGFEALLVFAALLAFLKKSGHADKRKYLYTGGLIGIAASIITAFIIAGLFTSSAASRETLEGIVSLVAAGIGVHELQEGGIIPETVVSYLPKIDWLGMYSNIETTVAQGILLLAAIGAVLFVFRRLKYHSA